MRFGRGGAIAAARGELDLALRWVKFVEVSSHRVGLAVASPSSTTRRPALVLPSGP
jgi:hypothetical protein